MEKIKTTKVITKYKFVSHIPIIYSDRFIQLRKGARQKHSKCFHCGKSNKVGSKIYPLFTDRANQLVCKKCRDIIYKQLKKEEKNEN